MGSDVALDILSILEDLLVSFEQQLLRYHLELLAIECLPNVVAYYIYPFLWYGFHSNFCTGGSTMYSLLTTKVETESGRLNSYQGAVENLSLTTGSSCEGVSKPGFNRLISTRLLPSQERRCGLATMTSTAVIAQSDKDIQH